MQTRLAHARKLLPCWPEYLVLVLFFMAVQIPAGVVGLEQPLGSPLASPASTTVWNVYAKNAGPPPFEGWPFRAEQIEKVGLPPTEIEIRQTWLRTSIESSHDDGTMHRSMTQTTWGWPLGVISNKSVLQTASASFFGDTNIEYEYYVAKVDWTGLTLNAFFFVVLAMVLVLLARAATRRRGKAAQATASDEREHSRAAAFMTRHRWAILSMLGIGLIASTASSALAAASLNFGARFMQLAGLAAAPWLTSIDGALYVKRWARAPHPSWVLPDRPERSELTPIRGGAGFIHYAWVTRPEGAYQLATYNHGWPLSTLADGRWSIPPSAREAARAEQRSGDWLAIPLHISWFGTLLNPVLAIVILWPLLFGVPRLIVWWIIRNRRLHDQCVTCRYDCYGLAKCPECGRDVEPVAKAAE